MTDHFVDPHSRFVTEGRRDRVLAVGATGDRHLGAAFGQISHRRKCLGDQAKEDPMSLAQHQKIAGLCNILRRRPPMHPPAMRFADDPAEFPDQRYDSVAGAREPLVDSLSTEQFQPGRTHDRVRCRLRDDAEFGLRLGECRLDVEPRLPSVFQAIEGSNAGVRYASGSREFIAHDGSSVPLGNLIETPPNPRGRYTARSPIASDSWTLRWRCGFWVRPKPGHNLLDTEPPLRTSNTACP